MSKFNQEGKRFIHQKAQKHCWNKWKKTQRSGKISCVHGSDKLVLLKSPYNQKLWYPSQTPMTLFIKLGKIKS